MFSKLTSVPEDVAIPVINELYNYLLHESGQELPKPREGQLDEEETALFLEIAKKLNPRNKDRYIHQLNDVFDQLTGFTGIPADRDSEPAMSTPVAETAKESYYY